MKPLPTQINKSKMVELYSDQLTRETVLTEIRSFQEQLNIPITKSIICNRIKGFFFKRFGLPTGYEMTDFNKFSY